MQFPGDSVVKNLLANAGDAGDMGLIPGLRRSPGVRNGNPLQYSCLGSPMNRGVWWAKGHRVGHDWVPMHALHIYCKDHAQDIFISPFLFFVVVTFSFLSALLHGMWNFSPWNPVQEIKPEPLEFEALILNHWTAMEVPKFIFFLFEET